MAGWNLKSGSIKDTVNMSDEEYWRIFNVLFSSRSKKRNSYKFGFLKSILDNLFNAKETNNDYYISYRSIFIKFTENYWNLITKYNLRQIRTSSQADSSAIEKIIRRICDSDHYSQLEFDSLNNKDKSLLIKEVEKECKRYVVGALYSDLEGKLYGFDLNGKGIFLSKEGYIFLLKYKPEIEKINYYEWAKFLEEVNEDNVSKILDKLELSTPRRNDLSMYREILYKEFEENNCFYCGKRLSKSIHVDHLIPWSFTKNDKIWNFVLSCPACNLKKSDNLVSEEYIDQIIERNRKLSKLNIALVKNEFETYNEGTYKNIWNYAKMGGFSEIKMKK